MAAEAPRWRWDAPGSGGSMLQLAGLGVWVPVDILIIPIIHYSLPYLLRGRHPREANKSAETTRRHKGTWQRIANFIIVTVITINC